MFLLVPGNWLKRSSLSGLTDGVEDLLDISSVDRLSFIRQSSKVSSHKTVWSLPAKIANIHPAMNFLQFVYGWVWRQPTKTETRISLYPKTPSTSLGGSWSVLMAKKKYYTSRSSRSVQMFSFSDGRHLGHILIRFQRQRGWLILMWRSRSSTPNSHPDN